MRYDFGYDEGGRSPAPYDIKLMRRLWPFARPYRKLFLISMVLVLAATSVEIALPLLTRTAIDRYIVPQSDPASSKPAGWQAERGDPQVMAVVARHPQAFEIAGQTVHIAWQDMRTLPVEEIAHLRHRDIRGLIWVGLLMMLIMAADFGINYGRAVMMERAGQNIMHDLRMQLFAHVLRLPLPFFHTRPSGKLVTRLTNDVQNMHELLSSMLVFVFKDLFLLVGIAVTMLLLDWRLALFTFALLPLVVWSSRYFSRKARTIFRVLRIRVAEINTLSSETLAGRQVIQTFNRESHNFEKFHTLNHNTYQTGLQQVRLFALFLPLMEVLAAVAIAAVIYYGGGRVHSGVGQALHNSISLGDLAAFLSFIRMFFRPIRDIAEKFNIMQNALASAERIFKLADATPEASAPEAQALVTTKTPPPAPARKSSFRNDAIVLKDVSFGYNPEQPVLEDISFKVPAGQMVALVGPTGAGKTTIANLVLGLYAPTRGQILVDGRDVSQYAGEEIRHRTAVVLQDPYLFSGSIRENILRGNPGLTTRELTDVLEAAQCGSWVSKLPQGLDAPVGEAGQSLSGGQRQLLAIARALAKNPELIILDEATSAIDSETEVHLQKAIGHLLLHRTAIVIAHRLATIRRADQILVFNRGRIAEQGTHDQLMAGAGLYYKFYQMQNLKEPGSS